MTTGSTTTILDDRYLLTEQLGEGGTAEVWRAWDHKYGVWCAVKLLRQRKAEDPRARQRFVDEGRTMLRFDHRNIVDATDLVEAERPYLVLELADGGSLKDWVDRYGSMPARMAVDVAIQIAKGIGAAHRLGVVHRDVKPHNVLLNRRGQCKVTDFGIARLMRPDGSTDVPDASTVHTQNAMGTLGYMAPEQRTDPKSADVRTDIYGIGATLYTLLTGRVVTNLFIAEREPELLDGIPELLVPILMQATAYKVHQRYESVQDLAKALFDLRNALPEVPKNTPRLAPDHAPTAAEPPALTFPPPRTPLPSGRQGPAYTPRNTPSIEPPILTPSPATFRGGTEDTDPGDAAQRVRRSPTTALRLALVFGTFIVTLLVLTSWVSNARATALATQRTFKNVIGDEITIINDLVQLGGDRAALQQAHRAVSTASAPLEVFEAGRVYVSTLKGQSQAHAQHLAGAGQADRVLGAIERLDGARLANERALRQWARRAETFPGLIPVTLRMTTPPRKRP